MNLQIIRNWVYAIPVSKQLQEVILEVLRIAVIATVSAIITYLLTLVNLLPATWQPLVTLFLTILGKEIDKYKFVANQLDTTRVKGVENYGIIGF